MTTPPDRHGTDWIAAKVAIEDQLGPVVPGGAQGGVVARERRAREGERRSQVPAALRARERVRRTFQPVDEDEAA